MKSVREMTDAEFKTFVGMDRKTCQLIMMHNKASAIPDRPMHPNAKMSGGDKPLPGITQWLIDLNVGPGSKAITSLNRDMVAGEVPRYTV